MEMTEACSKGLTLLCLIEINFTVLGNSLTGGKVLGLVHEVQDP